MTYIAKQMSKMKHKNIYLCNLWLAFISKPNHWIFLSFDSFNTIRPRLFPNLTPGFHLFITPLLLILPSLFSVAPDSHLTILRSLETSCISLTQPGYYVFPLALQNPSPWSHPISTMPALNNTYHPSGPTYPLGVVPSTYTTFRDPHKCFNVLPFKLKKIF